MTTQDKIKQIVADTLSIKPDELDVHHNFADDLGADSLGKFEIMIEIEEQFQIELPDDVADKANTIALMADVVDKLNA